MFIFAHARAQIFVLINDFELASIALIREDLAGAEREASLRPAIEIDHLA